MKDQYTLAEATTTTYSETHANTQLGTVTKRIVADWHFFATVTSPYE